jgi:mono/diheme cytochrome c family protein
LNSTNRQEGAPALKLGTSIVILLAACTLTQGLLACALLGSSPPSGAALFRRSRCIDCHGDQGQGSANGPALEKIGSKWSVELLTEFIGDPEKFRMSDARLDEISVRHNSRMTPFDTLPTSDRRALATYLISEHN